MKYQVIRTNKHGKSYPYFFDAPPVIESLLDHHPANPERLSFEPSSILASMKRANALKDEAFIKGLEYDQYRMHLDACLAFLEAFEHAVPTPSYIDF